MACANGVLEQIFSLEAVAYALEIPLLKFFTVIYNWWILLYMDQRDFSLILLYIIYDKT